MNRPRVLVARHLLARYLFVAWNTIAPREVFPDVALRDEDYAAPCFDPRQSAEERLLAALEGRFIEVWVPLNLERRLKAALHRMNGDLLTSGWDEKELFDPREDVGIILISSAKYGIKDMEIEDDVYYDENTGLALDRLQEIS